ncbi:MAG: hypothetical protein IPK94_05940 [Saprospiraceae bacterium]|nr:hypothetical protein [Saprospiraceae bacterium]
MQRDLVTMGLLGRYLISSMGVVIGSGKYRWQKPIFDRVNGRRISINHDVEKPIDLRQRKGQVS